MAENLDFNLNVKKNDLSKTLDSGIKQASTLEGTLSTALGVFGGGLLLKGASLFADALGSIVNVGKEAVENAIQQEIAVNNLNNALARSGNYSKAASLDMQEYASSLQNASVYGDDLVLNNVALLQSLTNLNTEGLKKGVSAAADLASVLGIDLEGATRLVAKAATGNVSSLQRYGIEIVKGRDNAESFANTLKALNDQFSGAAKSQLNTYAGALAAAKNAYGDMLEPLGDIIIKSPLVVAALNTITGKFNETGAGAAESTSYFQELLQDGVLALAAGSEVLLDAMDGLTVISKALVNTLQILGGTIGLALISPFVLLTEVILEANDVLLALGFGVEGLVNPFMEANNALQEFTNDGVEGFKNAADSNVFRKMSDEVSQTTDALIDAAADVAMANAIGIKNGDAAVVAARAQLAEKIAAEEKYGVDIANLKALILSEEKALNDQLYAEGIEDEFIKNELKLEAIHQQKIAEAQAIYEGELLKNEAGLNASEKELADRKAYEALTLASIKASAQKEIDIKRATVANTKKLNEEREANQKDTFATMATLASSGNKTLAAIGKASALAQIAIDGPAAVTKALAAFPPPFNFAAAGAVGVAVAAQAAKVVGVQFANSGFIGNGSGATMGSDNTMAAVRSGEMVLNGDDQKTLFDAIKGGGLGGGQPIIIQINSREIARAVRDEIQGGFRLV